MRREILNLYSDKVNVKAKGFHIPSWLILSLVMIAGAAFIAILVFQL